MYVQEASFFNLARLAASLGVLALAGCGTSLVPGGSVPPRTTLNVVALDVDSEDVHVEAAENGLFDLADPVDVDAAPRMIQGFIDDSSDVDVYDLGPMVAGDRVVVTLTSAPSLDGAIALFDDAGSSLLVNDHRNVYLGRAEPFVDVVFRRASSACFIAVSATPGFGSFGEYVLTASVEPATALPDLNPESILMVFGGDRNVVIGGRRAVDVPVFDAADIWTGYAGRSDEMIREILDRVREDYAAFDVTILSTSEGDEYEPGMSRLFFGTFDPALLGVAEGVDEFNVTTDQEAIVFTDTFAAFLPLAPSLNEMGQALANVASHEIGHLLGMIHTNDPLGIMDVTGSLNELMEDQTFRRSPLFSLVFPLGNQNAPQYLLDAVGGDPAVLFSKSLRLDPRMLRAVSDPAPRPAARHTLRLSTCSLEAH